MKNMGMCSQNKEYFLAQILKVCIEQIKSNEKINTKYLADTLNDAYGIERFEVKTDVQDPYNLQVTLRLPLFIPTIREEDNDKDLWYVCTLKNLDLLFKVKNNKIYFNSKDYDILEFLEEIT
jgi:hypothetical protein